MPDPTYQGRSKAIHVMDDVATSFDVPSGPSEATPRYPGRSNAIRTIPEAPQWTLEEVVKPPVTGQPQYAGQSQAIHVRGPKVVVPTPQPIPSCRCCAESGSGSCSGFTDFGEVRSLAGEWGTADNPLLVWQQFDHGSPGTTPGVSYDRVNGKGVITVTDHTISGGSIEALLPADEFTVEFVMSDYTTDDEIGYLNFTQPGFASSNYIVFEPSFNDIYLIDSGSSSASFDWRGDPVHFKAERTAAGTRLKWWYSADAEPAAWTLSQSAGSRSDPSALSFEFDAASNNGTTATISELLVTKLPATPLPGSQLWSQFTGDRTRQATTFGGTPTVVDGPNFNAGNATAGWSGEYDGLNNFGTQEIEFRTWSTWLLPPGSTYVTLAGVIRSALLASDFLFAGPSQDFLSPFTLYSGTWDPDLGPTNFDSVGSVIASGELPGTTAELTSFGLFGAASDITITSSATGTTYDPGDSQLWVLFQAILVCSSVTGLGRQTWFAAPGHSDGSPQLAPYDRFPNNPSWHYPGHPGDYDDFSTVQNGVRLEISDESVHAYSGQPVPLSGDCPSRGDCSDCVGVHTASVETKQRTYIGALPGWGYVVYERVPGPSDTGTTGGGTIEEGWTIGGALPSSLTYPTFAGTPDVLLSEYENSQFFNFGSPRSNGLATTDLYYRVALPPTTTRVVLHTDLIRHAGSSDLVDLNRAGIPSWPSVNLRAGHVTSAPTSIHDPAGSTVATVTPHRVPFDTGPGPADFAAGPGLDVDLPFTTGDDSVTFWFEFLSEPFQSVLGLVDDSATWGLQVALSLEEDSGSVHHYAYVDVYSVESALVDCDGNVVSPIVEVDWTYGTLVEPSVGTPPSAIVAGASSTNPDWTATVDSHLPRDGLNLVNDAGRVTMYAEADLSEFTGAVFVNGQLDIYYEFLQGTDEFQGHTLRHISPAADVDYDRVGMSQTGAMWAFSSPLIAGGGFAGVRWSFSDESWASLGVWTILTFSDNGSIATNGFDHRLMSGPIEPGVRYSVRINIDKFAAGTHVFHWRVWRTEFEAEPADFGHLDSSSVFLATDTFKTLWSWADVIDGGSFEFDGDNPAHYVDALYRATMGRRRIENVIVNGVATGSLGGGETPCAECDDPSNPGFQLPDFTPGFMPTFRRQIGDPTTSLDSFICTMESAAMVLDWHTRGAISVWGGELIPWCGKTEAEIRATGSNLSNARQAWSHYGQTLGVRSGQTFADMMAALAEGRAVILQGDYGVFSLVERCQDSFEGNHAISVYPYMVQDRILVGDPLCSTYHGIRQSTLQAYAEALGRAVFGTQSPQPILFAVSRAGSPP